MQLFCDVIYVLIHVELNKSYRLYTVLSSNLTPFSVHPSTTCGILYLIARKNSYIVCLFKVESAGVRPYKTLYKSIELTDIFA